MNLDGLFRFIVKNFKEKNIHYALIGGFALHAAGYARATGDIDFLIDFQDSQKAKETLFSLGYKVAHESEDVLNMVNPQLLIGGVDFLKAHRTYAVAMLQRAKPYVIEKDFQVPAVIPEDLIGLKVQAMNNDEQRRLREMSDVEWLIKNHWGQMDQRLVEEYFDVFDMKEEMAYILQRIKNAD